MQINFSALVFIISSVFLIIISIPLILKKIKPNNYYGFRVKKTMENEDIWYKANKFSGIILLIAEILYLIVFMFLLLFNNKLVSNNLYIIHLIIFITPLIFTAIISFIYVYKLKPSSPVNKKSENFLKNQKRFIRIKGNQYF